MVVEPAGRLPESTLLRLQVLGSELAEQVSPLGAAVAVDLVDGRGARVEAGRSLDLAFSLADVEVPVAASGWERLRLVWWSDCHERRGVVDCSGREVLDTSIDRRGRVLRASVDPDKLAQETAARVEESQDVRVPAAEVDAELRLGVLIWRRDAALRAGGQRWSGPDAVVFVGRPEPVGSQRPNGIAGEELAPRRPASGTSEVPADSSLAVEGPEAEGATDRSPTAGVAEVAPSGTG